VNSATYQWVIARSSFGQRQLNASAWYCTSVSYATEPTGALKPAYSLIMPKLLMKIEQVSVVQGGTGTLSSPLRFVDTSPASDIEQALSRDSGDSLVGTSQTSVHLGNPADDNHVMFETRSLARTCQQRCPCQCHIPLKLATPQWLQNLVGSTFAHFVGTPVFNHRKCNFRKCGSGEHVPGSIRTSYVFPLWLLCTGISFTASWSSLHGPSGTWHLKIPRMLEREFAYDGIWQAIKFGSVLDMSRAMASRGIRAYDLFPQEWWQTLLVVRILEIPKIGGYA
jgi:hypothetical protein